MSTEKANKKHKEVPPAGQEFLQPIFNRRVNQVDECSVWIPSQVNMDQGRQGRKLHGADNAQRTEYDTIVPTNK